MMVLLRLGLGIVFQWKVIRCKQLMLAFRKQKKEGKGARKEGSHQKNVKVRSSLCGICKGRLRRH